MEFTVTLTPPSLCSGDPLPEGEGIMYESDHYMCGIIGIHNHPEASNIAYLGLYALQHRGQESAGIVTSDGEREWFCDACFTGDYPVDLTDAPHIMDEAQSFKSRKKDS